MKYGDKVIGDFEGKPIEEQEAVQPKDVTAEMRIVIDDSLTAMYLFLLLIPLPGCYCFY